MTVTVLDDLVPLTLALELEHQLLATEQLPWYWLARSVSNNHNVTQVAQGTWPDHAQFYHSFLNGETAQPKSSYWYMIEPLIQLFHDRLAVDDLLRVKANLQQGPGSSVTARPHVDQHLQGHLSIIYYVNNSDGDTVIYSQRHNAQKQSEFTEVQRVKPRRGRLVILPSDQFHSSSTPGAAESRCVINTVYRKSP